MAYGAHGIRRKKKKKKKKKSPLPSQQPSIPSIVAAVTLLSESTFSVCKLPNVPLTLQPFKVNLSSVQGLKLDVAGTLTLLVTLAPKSKPVNVNFYILKQYPMLCDGLLGFDSNHT